MDARVMLPRDVGKRPMMPILMIEPSNGIFRSVRGTSVGAYMGRIS